MKKYDCNDDRCNAGCGECKICEYLAYQEWVQSVGGSGDRDPEIDKYLLEKYQIKA